MTGFILLVVALLLGSYLSDILASLWRKATGSYHFEITTKDKEVVDVIVEAVRKHRELADNL